MQLNEPIKVRWTGYSRQRIHDYNIDFSTDRSDLICNTLERQKTNVVVETVEEAEAIIKELNEYDSSRRIWMNTQMDKALGRVRKQIIDSLENQGHQHS